MNHNDFIFWTEVLRKQQKNLETRIDNYISTPKSIDLYLIKASALQITLTAERLAALEGVKI